MFLCKTYITIKMSILCLSSHSDNTEQTFHNWHKITHPSNIDEESVKKSLLRENASPEMISKNLAELKANKISLKLNDQIVLGADSVIDINKELISKPKDREGPLKY